MLKITYSDSDIRVEQLAIAIETVVAQRSVVALRSGQSLLLQPGYGSLTLPTHLPGWDPLHNQAQHEDHVAIAPCDADWLEVTLRGIWLSDSPTSEEGILLADLGEALERQIIALWHLSRHETEALSSSPLPHPR